MEQYGKLSVDGVLRYPPSTIVKSDGTTVVGYDKNIPLLIADGWMEIVHDPKPLEPCAPVYSIQDGKIRVGWMILTVPEPVPQTPMLIEGGVEVPVVVFQSQVVGKGIGVVMTDEGDFVTYVDHESPRPSEDEIKARIAEAVENKRKAKINAKNKATKGNLQQRIEAIEKYLGII